MTDEKKNEAGTCHVRNPPAYKCGYRAELVYPSAGLDYTPFFRCPIPLSVIQVIYFVVIKILSVCKQH
jgi:hypothetical protein